MQKAVKSSGKTCVYVHMSNALVTRSMTAHLRTHLKEFLFVNTADNHADGRPELFLLDRTSIEDGIHLNHDGAKTLIMDTGLEPTEIVSLMSRHRISGVVVADSDLGLLARAIRVVLAGELWFSRDMMKCFIDHRGWQIRDDGSCNELSARETEVVRLICEGRTSKEIAASLGLAEQTVKAHLSRIYRKLNVTNRSQLASLCAKKGLS